MESKSTRNLVNKITLIYGIITAIIITIIAIKHGHGTSVLIICPLYVSIYIQYLQSKVNRYAWLLGSINSLFYSAVYIYDGLYLMAIQTILISITLQLITFIRWNKKDKQGETIFKRLTTKQRGEIALAYGLLFIAFYSLMKYLGTDYGLYDCLVMLLNILINIIRAVPYVEYTPLQVANAGIQLYMYNKMATQDPLQYTYVAYLTYCSICVTITCIRVISLYRKQSKQKTQTNKNPITK